jgi:hypothetical protein
MDEKTRRINGLLPEATVLWLEAVAKHNKWTLSRTIRWAIHETMEQDIAKAEEAYVRANPHVMQPSGLSAKDAFPDDQQ